MANDSKFLYADKEDSVLVHWVHVRRFVFSLCDTVLSFC